MDDNAKNEDRSIAGLLMPGERLDDLEFKGLKIIQSPDMFRFGMDSVLLAWFAQAKRGELVADLGTGSGILPILMCGRYPGTQYHAWEIQPRSADMARRSVLLNGLDNIITIHEGDLRNAYRDIGHGSCKLVVCNPPYAGSGSATSSPKEEIAIARNEHICGFDDIAKTAANLLQNGGRFAFIFPCARLLHAMDAMRSYGINPKEIKFIYPKINVKPKLALINGIRNGKDGLNVLEPLIIHKQNGEYTDIIHKIYNRHVPN